MLNLATETDIERLRQAALLLEQENARLFHRLESLASELRDASGDEAESLQIGITHLKEQLANRTKALFGDSSERRPCAEHNTDERKEPCRGHGPREQKTLPIVEVIHELDEPDQACPSCGGDLQPMTGQFEEADEIDAVERSFRVVRHKRQKYRCRCGAGIETALGPGKLVAGGRYSIDFAVDVAIAKFADHLPLERQVRQMARDGLARFQCPGPKGFYAWRSRGPHRFPGDPSRISALLTDPDRTARPSRKRNERCCPRIQHDEGSGELHDVEARSHSFDTHYLRFGRRVAAEPARLASGRSLAFTGRESNPLDRSERFRTVF